MLHFSREQFTDDGWEGMKGWVTQPLDSILVSFKVNSTPITRTMKPHAISLIAEKIHQLLNLEQLNEEQCLNLLHLKRILLAKALTLV